MASDLPLTRRRFLGLAGTGLAGATISGSVRATDDRRAVFVHPAKTGDDVAAAVRANDGVITREYSTLDFVAARIPAGRRPRLERDRRVGGVERDDFIGNDGVGFGGEGIGRAGAGADGDGDAGATGRDGSGADPAVETRSATDIGTDSATLRGALTDLGGASDVDVRFDARAASSDTWASVGDRTLDAPGEYETRVTLERDDTAYEFRAVAESARGSKTSDTETFRAEGDQPDQDASWGHDRIFGNSADTKDDTYATATGAGVNVGILDTGIRRDHPDVAGAVAGGVNFSAGASWADDDTGHGTHVGGIVAAADDGLGTVGVAPDATLWSVKVFHEGAAHVSDIVAGIDWCVENDVEIISMSLSLYRSESAAAAIETAYEEGHLIVTSAANEGNDGDGRCDEDTLLSPADHGATVAVTAMDADETVAGYSSVGPDGEVMAPGTNIEAPVPGNAYGRRSGTSMACPMVSGVAALAWEARGGEGPDAAVRDDVRSALGSEAEPVLGTCEEGAGLVRADRVVEALDE